MFNLAHMYSDGLGVAQDWEKAVHWYTRAYEGGSVPACYRLGVIREDGRDGSPADPAAAAGFFEKCVGAGYDPAMVRLGDLYMEGRGVQRNPDKAVKLYIQASNENNADAMLRLGKASLSGEGMVKSANNAKKWLRKASARGNEEAKSLLETL